MQEPSHKTNPVKTQWIAMGRKTKLGLSDSSWASPAELMWVYTQHELGRETLFFEEGMGKKITAIFEHKHPSLQAWSHEQQQQSQRHLSQAWWKSCNCSRI